MGIVTVNMLWIGWIFLSVAITLVVVACDTENYAQARSLFRVVQAASLLAIVCFIIGIVTGG